MSTIEPMPTEAADVLRGLDKLVIGDDTDQLRMSISTRNNSVFIELYGNSQMQWSYSLQTGEGIKYADGAHSVSVDKKSFGDFCKSLARYISESEGRIRERIDLETAIGCISTLSHRDEFLKHGVSLEHAYFQPKYAQLREMCARHHEELDGFPTSVLDPAIWNPDDLRKAEAILQAAIDRRQGRPLLIANLRELTRFRRTATEGSTLLFDPLDHYFTDERGDRRSKAFKEQLEKHATEF